MERGRHQKTGLLLEQLREVGKAGVGDNPQAPGLASGRIWATHQVLNMGAAGPGKEDAFSVVKSEVLRGSRTKPVLSGCWALQTQGRDTQGPRDNKMSQQ